MMTELIAPGDVEGWLWEVCLDMVDEPEKEDRGAEAETYFLDVDILCMFLTDHCLPHDDEARGPYLDELEKHSKHNKTLLTAIKKLRRKAK